MDLARLSREKLDKRLEKAQYMLGIKQGVYEKEKVEFQEMRNRFKARLKAKKQMLRMRKKNYIRALAELEEIEKIIKFKEDADAIMEEVDDTLASLDFD